MIWFTCAPRRFVGNQAFLDRDSGLLCLGFRALGQDSRAVQLGPPMDDDLPEVIRASQSELRSEDWWKATGANGVVFFSYGSPRYRSIADAIASAGLKLVQVADTHGVISPWADAGCHLRTQWHYHWEKSIPARVLRTVASIPSSYLRYGFTRDPARVRMMLRGDFFCGSTPGATERYQRMVRRLAGKEATAKVRHLPIPVGFHFRWQDDFQKADEVVAVGRWDSTQKRTPLLLEAIRFALDRDTNTVFRIFGNSTPQMEIWHQKLPDEFKDRVAFEGKVPNSRLADACRRAKTMLVSAAYEGCHISSAEALCCGCSVVACQSPFLCALEWHAGKNSGTLAARATGASLGQALLSELENWKSGLRDPESISRYWTSIFHPDRVARMVLEMINGSMGAEPVGSEP